MREGGTRFGLAVAASAATSRQTRSHTRETFLTVGSAPSSRRSVRHRFFDQDRLRVLLAVATANTIAMVRAKPSLDIPASAIFADALLPGEPGLVRICHADRLTPSRANGPFR